ncbi:hydroxyacid dehydrogenase [Streptomyces sp. NPDC058741]|uniref:hydroxyacid dehydrogenase n=1 Tax=Streptomyces sp. NPDC058741 TaxID=3346620 RepID=UPI0036A434BB
MSTALRAVLALDTEHVDAVFPPSTMTRLRNSVTLSGPVRRLEEVDVSDTNVLITSWGGPRIDATLLARAPRLRAVIHAAGSVKAFVTRDVFERGIVVSSAAQANAAPVAEYTTAVTVLAAKGVLPFARLDTLRGRDLTAPDGIGLRGRKVGVVGASRIGRLVIGALHALGARVLLADPYADAETARGLGVELVGLDTLCRRSDIVTIHAPELPSTHHMFDRRQLNLLPPEAVLINTARGSLVDHDALADVCATGSLSAVLDVTDPEPLPADHPLRSLPNVLLTPHLAGACGRERRLLGEFAADETERLVAGLPLLGTVRFEDLAHSA